MASGFKTATVNGSNVAATLTNYPAYVDLSRLGITTLAEAQSVRVYADEAKTTEWAREIVSATEMHVLVPSLTSTVDIYVDWDGVSSDYAATDTYGRNAVWSDYVSVWHLDESSGNRADSKAGTNTLADVGTVTSSTGQIGTCATFARANGEELTKASPTGFNFGTGAFTMQGWFKKSGTLNTLGNIVATRNSASSNRVYVLLKETGEISSQFYDGANGRNADGTVSSPTTWNQFHFTRNGGDATLYLNGSSLASNTASFGTPANANIASQALAGLAFDGIQTTDEYNGDIDEVRVRATAFSANWITTEYNNQNDEATFWGTWTDAGGGGSSPTYNALSLSAF